MPKSKTLPFRGPQRSGPTLACLQAGQLLADALGKTLAVVAPAAAGTPAVLRLSSLTPAQQTRVLQLIHPRDLSDPR